MSVWKNGDAFVLSLFIFSNNLSTVVCGVPSYPNVSIALINERLNFVYSDWLYFIAFIILISFLFNRYDANPIGPECFTNFLPYSDALGKSLKLLTPGVLPIKPGNSFVILRT